MGPSASLVVPEVPSVAIPVRAFEMRRAPLVAWVSRATQISTQFHFDFLPIPPSMLLAV